MQAFYLNAYADFANSYHFRLRFVPDILTRGENFKREFIYIKIDFWEHGNLVVTCRHPESAPESYSRRAE